ncbi:hypothetical protein, partial [Bartonella taylorii]|uniref:hypothetical protein n=1 Tax=Bartonella taylorii TaxID=33046 RepID=UPI001ABAC25B
MISVFKNDHNVEKGWIWIAKNPDKKLKKLVKGGCKKKIFLVFISRVRRNFFHKNNKFFCFIEKKREINNKQYFFHQKKILKTNSKFFYTKKYFLPKTKT